MKTALSSRLMSLLALLLVAVMMLTMVGCGGGNDDEPIIEGDVSTTDPVGTTDNVGGNVVTDATVDPSASDVVDPSASDVVDPSASDVISTDATTQPTGATGATTGATGATTGATGATTGKTNATTGKTNGTTGNTTVGTYTVPTYTYPSYTYPSYTSATTGKTNGTTGKTNATTGATNAPTLRPSVSATNATTKPTSQTTVPIGQTVLEQVPASLKGTQIKMLVWWTPGTSDNNKKDEFKAATGIDVKYETAAMDKYQNNLSAMVMAQNSPAIAAIINEWYPQPITRGLMQSLNDVKVDGINFKDGNVFALSLMDQFGYKGEHYGINLKTSTNCTFHVMFFNKDLLKQSGVKEDPYTLWKANKWNWDTCLEIAKKCTNAKKGISGLSNVGQYYWMLSSGEDYVKSTNAGLKSNINSSGVLAAWNWNWDMINTHKVVDTSYTGQTPFYQGKAAMLGIGSFAMQYDGGNANYVPKNMKDDWGVVPFPSPAGKTYAAADGTVWGFPARVSGNKLQAAAWYLRYYLDEFNIPEVREKFFDPDHPESWEVMQWMWSQKIQSYNSVGVLTYGGEYTAYSIQYSLLDEADTKAKIKSNLESWVSVLESNISKIEKEMS